MLVFKNSEFWKIVFFEVKLRDQVFACKYIHIEKIFFSIRYIKIALTNTYN